jgi:hypothetical protein
LVERQVTYLVIGDNGPASHKGKKQDQHQRTGMLSKWWLSIHATFFYEQQPFCSLRLVIESIELE